MEILGFRFYMTGFSLLLMTPFLVWLLIRLLRWLWVRQQGSKESRHIQLVKLHFSLWLTIALFIALHWDIAATSYKVNKLCREQGGLHVYKTAEVEGFLGGVSIEAWSEYGFSYVEMLGAYGDKYRYTIKDGREHREIIDEFKSQYMLDSDSKQVDEHVKRVRRTIRDRHNGEVLGDLVFFNVYPGWIDRFYYKLVPIPFSPIQCGVDRQKGKRNSINRYYTSDLITSTLKSK